MEKLVSIGGVYEHFKGTIYIVNNIAKHTETGEELVIYCKWPPPYDEVWARPIKMFTDEVDRKNYKGPRFRSIG